MIDISCHVLGGTPCGPDSFAESLEMCRSAIADGVSTIVATPRWEAGSLEPPLPFEECRRSIERLEAETRGDLSFRLGFALQFSAELPELVARHGQKLALAGKRYLLISLPSMKIPAGTDVVWKSLAQAGFSVILAHPECNTVLRRDAVRLEKWVSEGLTLQIDSASVAGGHGREVQRFALECLRKYELHAVVASNARRSADQKTSLGKTYEQLMGKVGARQAQRYVRETPAALIGESLGRYPRRGFPYRGLTSLFRPATPIKA